jgi:drug/metabolite transporter (DMT)-like permease
LSALQVAVAAGVMLVAWLAVRMGAWWWGAAALPPGRAREVALPAWSGTVAWQIAYLTLFGTLATFLLWAWGQARMTATHAAVIYSLEPVFATAFAVLLRGSAEWTGPRATLGALLVLTGVIVSELRWGRERRRARKSEDERERAVSRKP